MARKKNPQKPKKGQKTQNAPPLPLLYCTTVLPFFPAWRGLYRQFLDSASTQNLLHRTHQYINSSELVISKDSIATSGHPITTEEKQPAVGKKKIRSVPKTNESTGSMLPLPTLPKGSCREAQERWARSVRGGRGIFQLTTYWGHVNFSWDRGRARPVCTQKRIKNTGKIIWGAFSLHNLDFLKI